MSEGSERTLQPTAWVPLIDANLVNGCMQVLPTKYISSHNNSSNGNSNSDSNDKSNSTENQQLLLKHNCCAGPTWYISIEEQALKERYGENFPEKAITCEIPMGGILLINQVWMYVYKLYSPAE